MFDIECNCVVFSKCNVFVVFEFQYEFFLVFLGNEFRFDDFQFYDDIGSYEKFKYFYCCNDFVFQYLFYQFYIVVGKGIDVFFKLNEWKVQDFC